MKDKICKYCANKDACKKCDKGWHDMFIPMESVKQYFQHGYNGVHGIHGYTYDFDTTNPKLRPTRSIVINGTEYCPYCGEEMYCIQDPETLVVTGRCCLCEGARAQLAYDDEEKALKAKHEAELRELRDRYRKQLAYDTEALFAIKLAKDRERYSCFAHSADYFATLNGKPYTDIKQLL